LTGEGDEKRRADRSHVVEVKAFSCLSGAPYPSLPDVTLQHPYTVTFQLLCILDVPFATYLIHIPQSLPELKVLNNPHHTALFI
jgi:hypothetical protein